ncbi:MAG TPA: hypothetical protein VHM92_10125 [Allosphingosinicella sp.]|nr:hypothetical protein [Allosphingosinicella sp.]
MLDDLDLPSILWTLAAAFLVLAAIAAIADRRRSRRAALDRVGWVPWTAIQVLALFLAIGAAGLAARG